MTLTYLHLDVFTRELFGGNQLAVYLDPPGDLPEAVMQSIAREMAFSETTFVFPPDAPGTDWRVRIFTPASELPMAGHPTIGTAFALARDGRVAPPRRSMVFREGVGPVPLDLEWEGAGLRFAWMTQAAPLFGFSLDRLESLASGLGLLPADLRPNGWPVQEVSCGVPFLVVPLSSREAVDRAVPDATGLARAFAEETRPACPVYLFTVEPGGDEADVYTRMFAPEIGIVEDAATGSASGPLGAYLVQHGLVPGARLRPIRNLQGVKMRRPSWIFIDPVTADGRITGVRVGGSAVVVGTGTIHL